MEIEQQDRVKDDDSLVFELGSWMNDSDIHQNKEFSKTV